MIFFLLTIIYYHQNSIRKPKTQINSKSTQLTEDFKIPSPSEVYQTLIGMQSEYPKGKYWTDASSGTYMWKGGIGTNHEIASMGTGCVHFCFVLSDAAFDTFPARPSTFKISDVRSGDVLRTDNNRHSVIVLQSYDEAVVIAEGNYNKQIHWGRVLTKSEVENADHLITRYLEGYIAPDDPESNKEIASGNFGTNGQLHLTMVYRPWNDYIKKKIISVRFESGITHIGNHAFNGANIYGLTIPGTVVFPEGTEVLGSSSFRGCSSLKGVTIPSTIRELKDAAFFSNSELATVNFLPGKTTVTIGDNLFSECWSLTDLTLPTLIDKISYQMFYNCRIPYLFIPHGTKTIGQMTFQRSSITALVIPNTNIQDIYFCGNHEQWNSIPKNNNENFIAGKTIHNISDVTTVKILN